MEEPPQIKAMERRRMQIKYGILACLAVALVIIGLIGD